MINQVFSIQSDTIGHPKKGVKNKFLIWHFLGWNLEYILAVFLPCLDNNCGVFDRIFHQIWFKVL